MLAMFVFVLAHSLPAGRRRSDERFPTLFDYFTKVGYNHNSSI
jgi:hypothetical protein